MIRQFSILLFAFSYLVSVTGLTLNMHYCGGELSCVSLLIPDDCCECPDETDSSCCSDSGIFLKASDDSHLSSSESFDFNFNADVAPLPQDFQFVAFRTEFIEESYQFFSDLPPPDRVIAFRTLLI
jgi:hypothetical protein